MSLDADNFLKVQLAAALLMTGLIWFVQVVHYPLMRHVAEEGFVPFSKDHQRRTSWVVGPPMLVEAASCAAVWLAWPGVASAPTHIVATVLLATIWLSTLLLQMPLHSSFLQGRDEAVIARLVRGNWIRTIAWTARSGLLAAMAY